MTAYHGLSNNTWEGTQNGWFCPNCQQLKEHKEFTDAHDRTQLVCVKCGTVFRAPKRLTYLKQVRRGGIVSMRRISITRMGRRPKNVVEVKH